MATLERIRRRSGLLIVVIGIAMLGFIMTDLLSSGDSIFRGDVTVVGKVDGRSIEYQEFSRRMEQRQAAMLQQNPEQARFITNKQVADAVWQEILREQVMGEQYEKLGFKVTGGELYRRLKNNPSIQQSFVDQSGRFNESQLQQYLNNIRDNRDIDQEAAQAYRQWVDFEANTKANALQNKYNQAVQKGIYVPTAIAREMHMRRNTQTTARFTAVDYSSIPDDEVSVDESDLKTYYQEHKQEFKTDQAASVQYVNFPISSSTKDQQEIQEELREYLTSKVVTVRGSQDTIESFDEAENDSLFAATRSDRRVNADYYQRENLPQGLDTSIFEQAIGHIEGPYRSGEFYTLSKIADKKDLPDSVNARHILLSFQGVEGGNQQRSFEEAQALADSLHGVLQEDSTQFGQLARELSDDPGSGARGGNLGWFDGQTMVRPFSNFAFRNGVGDIGRVMSQFGIHIIQILDQEGENEAVKLINISREIAPSDNTLDSIYSRASSFATSVTGLTDFSEKAEAAGYSPRPVDDIKAFDENIPGLGNNREIVKWAHDEETETGDIQLFNNGNASYVVVMRSDFTEEGFRPFEAVKERVRPEVLKEKKAKQLEQRMAEAIQNNENLQAVANALGTSVNDQVVNFGSSSITGFGSEPKVVGAMTGIEPNKLSQPIRGNRGVYLVEVNNRQPAQELPSYNAEQQQQAQTTRSLVTNQLFESLKKDVKIEDRRAKFF